MPFNSYNYWFFFALVLALVYFAPSMLRRPILATASFVFYSAWSPALTLLLVGSSFFNWATALGIDRTRKGFQKILLTACVAVNLGLLGFFKYYNFLAGNIAEIINKPPAAFALDIILPIAISFYTFEAISYNVDVFRGGVKARRSIIDIALLLSFFPHLVAGPILRPSHFFPQLNRTPSLTSSMFRIGCLLILKGLVKKTILADNLALIVDSYYSQGLGHSGSWITLIAIVAFSFQIYFDFSGYTDVARGCARLLGFKFPPNFERPYLSSNIAEFWRRWHISLSTWLREYLYIPLGGNRRGAFRTNLNLVITMGLGGLWHGASWNFMVWGLYHGILLVLHRLWRRIAPAPHQQVDLKWLGIGLTFAAVTLGWVPFRAPTFEASATVFMDLFGMSKDQSWSFPSASSQPAQKTLAAVIIASVLWILIDRRRRFQAWLVRGGILREGVAIFAALTVLALLARTDTQIQFIYFQF